MAGRTPEWERQLDDVEAPVYTVGVVAELLGVDPQVVRRYEQSGVISPGRTDGGQRRYSRRDIARLARALALAGDGVPIGTIGRVLGLEDKVANLESTDENGGRADGSRRRR